MKYTLSLLSIAALLFQVVPATLAESYGEITVTQMTPIEGMIGRWDILTPSNIEIAGHRETEELGEQLSGQYTIFVDPPEGASAEIKIYRGASLLTESDHSQATFTLDSGSKLRIEIHYEFTRTGTVSVTSDPVGLRYTLKGPNNFSIRGITPESYQDVPEGLWSAEFDDIPNCLSAKPVSDRLVKDSRISLSIEVACNNLPDNIGHNSERTLEFVTARIDGDEVTFTDLPLRVWFSPFADAVLRTGIMKGRTDRNGKPTGEFDPEGAVNLAELSVVAHKISSTDVSHIRLEPQNARAKGSWFEKYYTSAEVRGWQAFQNHREDPARPATRGEVVATLMQALGVPRYWARGVMFTDVKVTTPYSSSIETAASDDIVGGYSDRPGYFGPADPISRAGLAKVLKLMMDNYLEDSAEIRGGSY